jgi:hypothetical protein
MYILQSYYIEPYKASDIDVIAVSESVETLKALAIESDKVFDQQWSKSQIPHKEYYELITSLPDSYVVSGFIITHVKMV